MYHGRGRTIDLKKSFPFPEILLLLLKIIRREVILIGHHVTPWHKPTSDINILQGE